MTSRDHDLAVQCQAETEHAARCPKARPMWLRHPLAECECYADILNEQRSRFAKKLDELFSRGPDRIPLHRRDEW